MLAGAGVRLEPIGPQHVDDLFAALCATRTTTPLWTYLFWDRPRDRDELAAIVDDGTADPGQVMYAIVPVETGRAAGLLLADADRPDHGLDRGRRDRLRPPAPAQPGRHRGDGPADAPRLRRPGLPPLRVEVRQPQRPVAPGRAPARLHLGGPLPQRPRLQGPQPRHRLVLDHRPRVAARPRSARRLARRRQLRRQGRQRVRLRRPRRRTDRQEP